LNLLSRSAARKWALIAGLALSTSCAVMAAAPTGSSNGPEWRSLNPSQQQILAPLAEDWQQLDKERKSKWLEIAARYPTMPADQQARMQQRMSEWARLSPQQRGQARANFQQAQQLPSGDRRAQWEAYQALPKERKEALVQQANKSSAGGPAAAASNANGHALRSAALNAQTPKSNIVAQPGARTETPRPVAPTVVQAGPGATTSLVTTPAKPPAHQKLGKPKIEADAGTVDPSTLLPRRGPQAAGVPVSAAASAQPVQR
jgi:hypothetical protein